MGLPGTLKRLAYNIGWMKVDPLWVAIARLGLMPYATRIFKRVLRARTKSRPRSSPELSRPVAPPREGKLGAQRPGGKSKRFGDGGGILPGRHLRDVEQPGHVGRPRGRTQLAQDFGVVLGGQPRMFFLSVDAPAG